MWLETANKVLIIIRGVSGSGKSFEVQKLLTQFRVPQEGHVFSTDDYLDKLEGGYVAGVKRAIDEGYWDKMIYKFHKMNQERSIEAMQRGISPIIIDNTNLTRKDIYPYVEAGIIYNYEIRFVEPSSEHWKKISPLLSDKTANDNRIKFAALRLANKNKHGVPYSSIYKMLKKYEPDIKPEDFQ